MMEINGKQLEKALINNKDLCDDFEFVANGNGILYYFPNYVAKGYEREFIFYRNHTVWKGVYEFNNNFLKLTCIDYKAECDKEEAIRGLVDWTFEDDDSIGLVHIISTNVCDSDIKVEFYWDMELINSADDE